MEKVLKIVSSSNTLRFRWYMTHESKSINDNDDNDDDDEQPADEVQGGGGKRPLGEKLPNGFEVTVGNTTLNLTGAIELHRLVLKDYDQLLKQKDEITKSIIESTCSVRNARHTPMMTHQYKEVSQPSLPLLPPQATPLYLAAAFPGIVTSVTNMHCWRL